MNSAAIITAVSIRAMQPADLEAVHAIEMRIFPNPWPLTSYQFEIGNPLSHKWVAEVADVHGDKQVVGMLILWLRSGEAHIGTIGVDRPYRRQGIAKQLLKIALASCAKLGAQTAALEVRASNAAALALYSRFGFEQVGRQKNYYHDNDEDALLLRLHNLDSELEVQI